MMFFFVGVSITFPLFSYFSVFFFPTFLEKFCLGVLAVSLMFVPVVDIHHGCVWASRESFFLCVFSLSCAFACLWELMIMANISGVGVFLLGGKAFSGPTFG